MLDSIRAKCVAAAAGGAHAAFGVVLYDKPCLHVGDGLLARSLLLAAGSSKSPWYDAFKGFVGEGLFTADGDDWSVHSTSLCVCYLHCDSFPLRAGEGSAVQL
jgi:hypothetical protein